MNSVTVVTIKPYGPADYQGLKKLLENVGIFDTLMDQEGAINRKSSRDPQSILVAHNGTEIIGCVVIVNDYGPLVFRLAVKQGEQKKGLGSQLLQTAEQQLRQQGQREVHLLVGERERDLQNYYEKRGYRKGNAYRWLVKKL